jgi:MFS family permease
MVNVRKSADIGSRARAIAYWAPGGSVAAAAGSLLGGALAEATTQPWRPACCSCP